MELLNPIITNMEESLIVLDKNGRVRLVNDRATHLTQVIFSQPVEPNSILQDVMPSQHKEWLEDFIDTVISTRQTERSFAEFTGVDETTLYLEFTGVPIIDDNTTITCILLFIKDITHQKVFEKKLVTNTENIRNFIETANAFIAGLDSRGYVTDWNQCCTTITGLTRNDVYAQKFTDILPEEQTRLTFKRLIEQVLQQTAVTHTELPIKAVDGTVKILLFSITPRHAGDGRGIGITLVGQDITELTEYRKNLELKIHQRTKQLHEALKKEKEAVEVKSRFVSVASHEFRTPLSSLKFSVNILRRKVHRHTEILDRLTEMDKHLDHMLFLLDDVLQYSKNEPGKIKLNIKPLEIKLFIEKIIEEVCVATQFSHRISCSWDMVVPSLNTDEKLVRNILINLLTNAIKYSPGKKEVALTVRCTDRTLTLRIADQGIGMTEEDTSKAFEAFRRSDKVSSIAGTGLGLSIAKRAADLLNGKILLESKLGEGTTATVIIPTDTSTDT